MMRFTTRHDMLSTSETHSYVAFMKRRDFLAGLAASLQLKAAQLPANKNIKWALSLALWNHFQRPPFTEILDVMRDTGFIGIRVTQFPGFLKAYDVTQAQIEKEI